MASTSFRISDHNGKSRSRGQGTRCDSERRFVPSNSMPIQVKYFTLQFGRLSRPKITSGKQAKSDLDELGLHGKACGKELAKNEEVPLVKSDFESQSFKQRPCRLHPSPTLVSYKFAECRTLPRLGEIIAVRLSQDLFGPGSEIATRNLPSGATQYNYHHAIVLHWVMEYTISMTILPMPAYSSTDPASGLSSTSWLLAQPEDFQRLHIPVPYDEDPTCIHPHPPFPVPAGFRGPLEIGGWKNSKPSWVQAVPQVIEMSETTTVRIFSAGCNH
jgi:hypothetical protein